MNTNTETYFLSSPSAAPAVGATFWRHGRAVTVTSYGGDSVANTGAMVRAVYIRDATDEEADHATVDPNAPRVPSRVCQRRLLRAVRAAAADGRRLEVEGLVSAPYSGWRSARYWVTESSCGVRLWAVGVGVRRIRLDDAWEDAAWSALRSGRGITTYTSRAVPLSEDGARDVLRALAGRLPAWENCCTAAGRALYPERQARADRRAELRRMRRYGLA